jgi:hypothetical protein
MPRVKPGAGCPIRRSRDQRSLASPPGFSQRATSFIASQCQGIHQMPLPIRLIAKPVACRDKPRKTGRQRTDDRDRNDPHAFRHRPRDKPHMKTLFRKHGPRPPAIGRPPQSNASVSLPLHPSKIRCQRPTAGRATARTGKANFSRSSPVNASTESRQRRALAARAALDTKRWRPSVSGGGERNRTVDLLLAKQALSQLSYTPRGQKEEDRRQGSEDRSPT